MICRPKLLDILWVKNLTELACIQTIMKTVVTHSDSSLLFKLLYSAFTAWSPKGLSKEKPLQLNIFTGYMLFPLPNTYQSTEGDKAKN